MRTENVSKLIYTKPQVQEAQRIPKRIKAKSEKIKGKNKTSPRHIIRKHDKRESKDEKSWKNTKEKTSVTEEQGSELQQTFSATVHARREWREILKIWRVKKKKKTQQPKTSYPVKLSFKVKEKEKLPQAKINGICSHYTRTCKKW